MDLEDFINKIIQLNSEISTLGKSSFHNISVTR